MTNRKMFVTVLTNIFLELRKNHLIVTIMCGDISDILIQLHRALLELEDQPIQTLYELNSPVGY